MSFEPHFLVNGERRNDLSLHDRSVHYGDGLFETIAVHDGKLLLWNEHFERLGAGCQRLMFPQPDKDILSSEIHSLVNDSPSAVVKIILSRGPSGRGYSPPVSPVMTRIIGLYPRPNYPQAIYTDGIELKLCQTRYSRNPLLAGIKHLNRLEQVMARAELMQHDCMEGMVLDTEDNVIEGTMSNLFMKCGRQLITPDLSHCGISGVVRKSILEMSTSQGVDVVVKNVRMNDIDRMDELFLCNSIAGIVSINRFQNQPFESFSLADRLRHQLTASNKLVPVL